MFYFLSTFSYNISYAFWSLHTSHKPSLANIAYIGVLSLNYFTYFVTWGVTITPSYFNDKSPNALVTAKLPLTLL